MMSGRPHAMSAPGSDPVTPLPPAKDQGTPQVQDSPGPKIQPGDDGKPPARAGRARGGLDMPEPSWKTIK